MVLEDVVKYGLRVYGLAGKKVRTEDEIHGGQGASQVFGNEVRGDAGE